MVKFFLVRKSYGTFGYKVSVFCRDEDGQAIEALKCKTTFNPVRQRVFQVKRTNINCMILQEGMMCIFFLFLNFLCHSGRYHGQNGYYTSELWIEQSGSKSLPKHCAGFLALFPSNTVPLPTLEYKIMGTSKLLWQPDSMLMGSITRDGLASHSGGVSILLATWCFKSWI